MISPEEECYEDSDPDQYATSVYSAPHWMISLENPNKRRKLRALINPQDRVKQRDISIAVMPTTRDLSPELPLIDLERKIKRKVVTKRMKASIAPMKNSAVLDQEIQRRLEEEEKTRLSYEEQIVSLFCNHCKLTFKAKPTYRRRFNHTLVNHSCSGMKRRQYVLGVKRRKCNYACNAFQGCIYRIWRTDFPENLSTSPQPLSVNISFPPLIWKYFGVSSLNASVSSLKYVSNCFFHLQSLFSFILWDAPLKKEETKLDNIVERTNHITRTRVTFYNTWIWMSLTYPLN